MPSIKAVMQKTKLVAFVIFLSFLVLESSLRLTGFALLSMQRAGNVAEYPNAYRILVLGESTTADLGKVHSSWPTELELILNSTSSKMKFEVFNEGVPGTNTAFILTRLEENLGRYKPDMVITMMGANDDRNNLKYQEKSNAGVISVVEDLRVYKAIKLLWLVLGNRTWDIIGTGSANVEFDAHHQLSLAKHYRELGMFEEAEKTVRRIIEINPRNNEVYSEVYRELTTSGFYQPGDEEDSKAFYKFYAKKGLHRTDDYGFEVTKINYQQLYAILDKRGIKYAAMQYPTMSVDMLKGMFNGDEDIIFVSNEENFNEAPSQTDYDDLFYDDFGTKIFAFKGNYGHTTLKGNQLIAENLADVILKEVPAD